jgi:hypothetical protein
VIKAADDKITTFMCRLSGNMWFSISWKPQGLYRYCVSFY